MTDFIALGCFLHEAADQLGEVVVELTRVADLDAVTELRERDCIVLRVWVVGLPQGQQNGQARLVAHGQYRHPYLKVRTLDVSPSVAEANGLDHPRGVLVVDVSLGPASGALVGCRGTRVVRGRESPVGGGGAAVYGVLVGLGWPSEEGTVGQRGVRAIRAYPTIMGKLIYCTFENRSGFSNWK